MLAIGTNGPNTAPYTVGTPEQGDAGWDCEIYRQGEKDIRVTGMKTEEDALRRAETIALRLARGEAAMQADKEARHEPAVAANRLETSRKVVVDASVVEAYGQAFVAAFESDSNAPVLASGDGEVRVEINGCMHVVQLNVRGSHVTMLSHQAIQTAVMLLAGAHAVREIGHKENPGGIY